MPQVPRKRASGTKTAGDFALSGCVAFARGHLAFEEVEHSARFSRAHFLAAGDGTGDDSGAVAKGLVSCRQAKALEGYGDVPELAARHASHGYYFRAIAFLRPELFALWILLGSSAVLALDAIPAMSRAAFASALVATLRLLELDC
jgi:hypothetical protein